MRYFFWNNLDKIRSNPLSTILWEERDLPRKELLKHPVPQSYKGTGEDPYLIQLFELTYDGTKYTVPHTLDNNLIEYKDYFDNKNIVSIQGIIPTIYTNSQGNKKFGWWRGAKLFNEQSIPTVKTTGRGSQMRTLLKHVLDRFDISYVESSKPKDDIDRIEALDIPKLMNAGIIPKGISGIYYLAIIIKHGLMDVITPDGLTEILTLPEGLYVEDPQGYLEIDSIVNSYEVYMRSKWNLPMIYFFLNKTWPLFYRLINTYGEEGFTELSEEIIVEELPKMYKIYDAFKPNSIEEWVQLKQGLPYEFEKILF